MKKIFFIMTFAVAVPGIAAAKSHTIIIEGMKFNPQNLMVSVGDKVTWVNKDIVPHTATAKDKSFNSGNIETEKSWIWMAKGKGNYPYKCLFHQPMKGTLIVK